MPEIENTDDMSNSSPPNHPPSADARTTVLISPMAMDAQEAEAACQMLTDAARMLLLDSPSRPEHEELVVTCYKLVGQGHGGLLHSRLKAVMADHVSKLKVDLPEEGFVQGLSGTWDDFHSSLAQIARVMLYLDRSNQNDDSVTAVGTKMFGDIILEDPVMLARLKKVLMDSVLEERIGSEEDKLEEYSAIKNILRRIMLLDGGRVYKIFENTFFKESLGFYRQYLGCCMPTEDSNYKSSLQKMEQLIQDELRVVDSLLDDSTKTTMLKTILELEPDWLPFMLSNSTPAEVGVMFGLFGRIEGGREIMLEGLSRQLLREGRQVVDEAPDECNRSLMVLRDRYLDMLVVSFEKDEAFEKTIETDLRIILDEKIKRLSDAFFQKKKKMAEPEDPPLSS